jgi:hypothetical protein
MQLGTATPLKMKFPDFSFSLTVLVVEAAVADIGR